MVAKASSVVSENNKSPEENKKSASEILVQLARDAPGAKFFHDDIGEAYAAFDIGNHQEIHKIRGQDFKLLLTEWFFEKTGKPVSADTLSQVLSLLEMVAIRRGKQKKLEVRVAQESGSFYYDLADNERTAVKITPGNVEIDQKPPILFKKTRAMSSQVKPNFSGKLSLLFNHVQLASFADKLLLLVYIVSCFIPGIPHPILVVSGEKGAAKSTLVRMLRAIVDPSARATITMPTKISDLSINLANNYMPTYDNIDSISADMSDLLCTASTGGGFSKRTLFTDADETIVDFQRCVMLNGISNVATRPDLLDRSLLLELQRLNEEARKEEVDVWAAFEHDRPAMLGGALRILSKAMYIYPNIHLDKLPRMADFCRWGYAIAEAAEIPNGGDRFLTAYQANIERSNLEAIESHPVASAVIALMDNRELWSGPVASLLNTLERVALTERINMLHKNWPKAAHVLSKRLKEVQSNLEKKGITFVIRHAGKAKEVTIEKCELRVSGAPTVVTSHDAFE